VSEPRRRGGARKLGCKNTRALLNQCPGSSGRSPGQTSPPPPVTQAKTAADWPRHQFFQDQRHHRPGLDRLPRRRRCRPGEARSRPPAAAGAETQVAVAQSQIAVAERRSGSARPTWNTPTSALLRTDLRAHRGPDFAQKRRTRPICPSPARLFCRSRPIPESGSWPTTRKPRSPACESDSRCKSRSMATRNRLPRQGGVDFRSHRRPFRLAPARQLLRQFLSKSPSACR